MDNTFPLEVERRVFPNICVFLSKLYHIGTTNENNTNNQRNRIKSHGRTNNELSVIELLVSNGNCYPFHETVLLWIY